MYLNRNSSKVTAKNTLRIFFSQIFSKIHPRKIVCSTSLKKTSKGFFYAYLQRFDHFFFFSRYFFRNFISNTFSNFCRNSFRKWSRGLFLRIHLLNNVSSYSVRNSTRSFVRNFFKYSIKNSPKIRSLIPLEISLGFSQIFLQLLFQIVQQRFPREFV